MIKRDRQTDREKVRDREKDNRDRKSGALERARNKELEKERDTK